ncbi:MAG: hypothetical protein ABSC91_02755 [Candidatus Bathyarchaeia archaeon]
MRGKNGEKTATTFLVFMTAISLVSTLNAYSISVNYGYPSGLLARELAWEKTFGGTGDDRAFYIVKSGDGGFLVVGSSTSFDRGKTFAWIVRIDQDGNMLWNRTYEERDGSEFRSAIRTDDGFVLVGNAFSSSGDEDGWIVKIDEQGNVLWNLTVGSKETAKFSSAAETSDGFILVGLTYSMGRNASDAWAVKIDTSGEVLWNKTYGGNGDNAFRAAVATDKNEYVCAGYTNSIGNGDYDVWLVKIDGNGTLQWSTTYGGVESDMGYALAVTRDGYVIAGETHSFGNGDAKAFVVKTDLNGKLLWQRAYGGEQFDSIDSIIPSSSGGYVVAGFTFSFGKGQRDFWIFSIDDSGNVLWSRTQGREGFEEAYSIVEVAKDRFVVAGWTNSIGNGKYDYYVVEMKVSLSDYSLTERVLLFYGLAVLAIAVVSILTFWRLQLRRQNK